MTLNGAAQKILDLIIPPRCLKCTKIVETQGALCGKCWVGLTFIDSPLCQKCGHPFDHHIAEDAVCAGCLHEAPPYIQARSLFAYNDGARRLILEFKHGDGVHMAPYFARWLRRLVPEEVDGIAPVPLHMRRLLKRTYNQSALLVNALSKLTALPAYPDLLKRTRHTPFQGGLNREKRQKNVAGAFYVNEKYKGMIKNKKILLVDDVYTTGATLNECTRVLNAANGGGVYALSLARVVSSQG